MERDQLMQERLKYATNFLDAHCRQRINMFNFFLITMGFFVAADVNIFATDKVVAVNKMYSMIAIGLIGLAIAIVFILIDKRNRNLVNCGWKALHLIETTWLYEEKAFENEDTILKTLVNKNKISSDVKNEMCWGIVKIDYKRQKAEFCRHSFLMPLMMIVFICALFILAILGIFNFMK